jgi:hypothetical protein
MGKAKGGMAEGEQSGLELPGLMFIPAIQSVFLFVAEEKIVGKEETEFEEGAAGKGEAAGEDNRSGGV